MQVISENITLPHPEKLMTGIYIYMNIINDWHLYI